ncbi:hypothetical protein SLEP1_g47626 [Rubroshorea leprosula]|uniref:Uncharacterized protein n=1 Tax=Rubroshorea leprosula TaxID=152421 RepID=A0AAV5LRY8_9ROSI|nr:hypothetical protein SLEP1_g47626 [Rubroshorea leprosula]
MSPYTYSGGLSFPPFFVISRNGLLVCYCSTVISLPLLNLVFPLFHYNIRSLLGGAVLLCTIS